MCRGNDCVRRILYIVHICDVVSNRGLRAKRGVKRECALFRRHDKFNWVRLVVARLWHSARRA